MTGRQAVVLTVLEVTLQHTIIMTLHNLWKVIFMMVMIKVKVVMMTVIMATTTTAKLCS